MKLPWINTEPEVWESKGDNSSYRVTVYHSPNLAPGLRIPEGYKVKELRQETGQVMRSMHVGTLEGAFARAQTWENSNG